MKVFESEWVHEQLFCEYNSPENDNVIFFGVDETGNIFINLLGYDLEFEVLNFRNDDEFDISYHETYRTLAEIANFGVLRWNFFKSVWKRQETPRMGSEQFPDPQKKIFEKFKNSWFNFQK